MQLTDITPVILTYNEAPNIARTLERLSWAQDIVVVDSYSTDETPDLVKPFSAARFFQRPFDTHRDQWAYAVEDTGISTEWVLTLDADYLVPESLVAEMAALAPTPEIGGFEAEFTYMIYGHPLRRCLYPPRIVLFRRARGTFYQDGHTQRVSISGAVGRLTEKIQMDDRKPLSHWIVSQDRYAALEYKKLAAARRRDLEFNDRLRTYPYLAPLLMPFYCLFVKRMLFEGLPGLYYTYHRTMAELILAMYQIEARLKKNKD